MIVIPMAAAMAVIPLIPVTVAAATIPDDASGRSENCDKSDQINESPHNVILS
jgi:hypothetical protein